MAEPLAYFITFTAYGTRLHGDDRGTVDRRANTFGTPLVKPAPARRAFAVQRLAAPPTKLDFAKRQQVEDAIREVCRTREWLLHAVHARTNHVHVVVPARVKPEVVMGTFKTWATRRLRAVGLVAADEQMWTRRGSTRYLWTERDVESACFYVVELQGFELD